jgi:hypothetical protein
MIRDDGLVRGAMDLSRWPATKAMYEAVGAVPEVRQWIEDWEASTAEMSK